MKRFLLIVFICCSASAQVQSQIFPRENSALNYRIVGFSFPSVEDGNKYKIEIAAGNYHSVDSFERNIFYSNYNKIKKIIVELPSFGKQYTWRVVSKGSGPSDGALHHFSISIVPEVDTAQERLRIVQHALKYKDAYVFLDGNRALYDMKGQPVWYLPDIDGFKTDNSKLRDMKLTSRGTITFIYEETGAYEVNYDGEVLWKAPNNGAVSGSSSEYYHHEFTRLANGHYMILGVEAELWNKHLPSNADSSYMIVHTDRDKHDSSGLGYTTLPFGTIIEYDSLGNVVWSWKSADYFKKSDIYYHTDKGQNDIVAHENSFYFDENAKIIYLGFRNLSRILKIKYPEGTVLASYGEEYKPGVPESGNGLFCRQHSVRRSDDGYLYLYNNNSCVHGPSLPQIIKMQEPANSKGQLKKIWEYDCTIDGLGKDNNTVYKFPSGGNVVELPDRDLFINMSSVYSKVFILSKDKEVLWSAIPEKWVSKAKKWGMIYQYRANIIDDRDKLEDMIWRSELK